MTHAWYISQSETSVSRSVRISPRAFPWQRSFILDNIISYSNLWPGTRFSLRATHSFCFRRHMLLDMWNIAQMLPKVRKSASGCSKCKIVLQTQKSAQKVLSAIGKGLATIFNLGDKSIINESNLRQMEHVLRSIDFFIEISESFW